MKKQLYILACALFLISLQSCVDSIPVPHKEVDAKLVFESDISDSKGFSAKITTSTGLDDVDAIGHPEDVHVSIRLGDTDDSFIMHYEESCKCYQELNRKPVLNQTYNLEAHHESNDIFEPISASMKIPYITEVAEMKAVREIETDGTTTIEATLNLDGKSYSSNYFHIIPFRKITVRTPGDDEVPEKYTGEIEFLELLDFNNDNLYIEPHFTKPGFLADFNGEDISNNPLNLLLHTNTVIDYENQSLTKLFFEVRSVTESYYRYEIYQSRKISSLQDGIVEAPISYSNVVNGLGYLGGYSTSLDSVLVQ